jgi:stage II sporulation protein D
VRTALLVLAVIVAGVSPVFADETPIRVSILHHQFQAVIASDGGLSVRPPGSGAGSPYVAPDVTTALDIRPSGGGLLLAGAIQAPGILEVSPAQHFPLSVDGKRFRGSAIVQSNGDGTLDVINVVDLEQYLYGVVGSEMDSDWPSAALEAQAIVARTFAVAHLGTREWLGYDLSAGEQDQAYSGMETETPAVTRAVDATRGKVLVYNGDLVHAYYSDSDGGYTSPGDALADSQAYLQAVPDPYCRPSSNDRWTVDVPIDAFAAAFAARYGDLGTITAVHPGGADTSGRLETVTILGMLDSREIPATVFRSLAGNRLVRSTRIDSIALIGGAIRVSGSGFGHGVGMAQCGARGMAQAGKSVEEILHFYYRGAELAEITDALRR